MNVQNAYKYLFIIHKSLYIKMDYLLRMKIKPAIELNLLAWLMAGMQYYWHLVTEIIFDLNSEDR